MKKITISDVAQYAGVSKSSVSFVLNQREGVSAKTRIKILEAIKELNYKPQFNFSSLDERKANILFLQVKESGRILTEQHAPFISQYINAAQESAHSLGYQLQVKFLEELSRKNLQSLIQQSEDLAGILVLGTELEDDEDFAIFQNLSLPLVFLDTFHPYLDFNFININNASAVFKVILHLKEQGHTQIGLASSIDPSSNLHARERAFYEACDLFHLESQERWIYRTHFDYTQAHQDFNAIDFTQDRFTQDRPSAIFAVSDSIALALHKSLLDRGFRLPQEMSIIGFDDLEASKMVVPALSTVRVSNSQLGHRALMLLVDQIEMQRNFPVRELYFHNERTVVSSELILRDSVASLQKERVK